MEKTKKQTKHREIGTYAVHSVHLELCDKITEGDIIRLDSRELVISADYHDISLVDVETLKREGSGDRNSIVLSSYIQDILNQVLISLPSKSRAVYMNDTLYKDYNNKLDEAGIR